MAQRTRKYIKRLCTGGINYSVEAIDKMEIRPNKSLTETALARTDTFYGHLVK